MIKCPKCGELHDPIHRCLVIDKEPRKILTPEIIAEMLTDAMIENGWEALDIMEATGLITASAGTGILQLYHDVAARILEKEKR